MYFTTSHIRSDKAAQLAVITAHELGERVILGQEAHVAFETVVLTVKNQLKRDPRLVAAQLLEQAEGKVRSALKIGLEEIVKMFDGEEKAMGFFRQVTTPRNALRFDSIGGVSEDIHLAKNRAAMMASKASIERFHNPDHDGLLPTEREYVDFMKSMRRSLDAAVERNQIKADLAAGLMTEVEETCTKDPRKAITNKILGLQILATEELFAENRERVIQRYAAVYAKDGPAKDAGVGRNSPEPS